MEKILDVREVIFDSRKSAEEVLHQMDQILQIYELVTVADLYDLSGITPSFFDTCYGWTNLKTAEVVRVRAGYIINLPKAYLIRNEEDSYLNRDNNYETDDKMVSHPDHYQSESGLEVIDVIEAFTADLKGIEAVDTGNAIKYLCRWKKKNGLQDLKKAMWYLTNLINHVEKETN